MTINLNKHIVNLQPSKISKVFINEVKEGIRSTGRSGEFAIRTLGVKYVLAKKASIAFPGLKNITPRGWPKGSKLDELDGVYICGVIGCFQIKKRRDMTAVVRHETGHGLSESFSKIIGTRLVDKKDYTDCYIKDLRKLKEKARKLGLKKCALQYLIQGSTPKEATLVGKDETFAEIYAKLHGGSISGVLFKDFDKKLDCLFSNTVAYVKKILLSLGEKPSDFS